MRTHSYRHGAPSSFVTPRTATERDEAEPGAKPTDLDMDAEAIEPLLIGIPLNAPVRRLVEALINGSHHPLHGVQPLFTALAKNGWRHWRERTVAAWAMGRAQLSMNERDAAAGMLLDVLEDPKGRSLASRIGSLSGQYFGALAVASALISILGGGFGGDPVGQYAQVLLILGFFTAPVVMSVGVYFLVRSDRRETRTRVESAISLGKLRAPESVGALAGALMDRHEEVREAAAIALHDVLPTITQEHLGTYGAQTMANLGKALRYQDTLLAYRILESLERVGTSSVLPYVERLAKEGRTTRVRDLALEVVETLEARRRNESDARILVRGSDSLRIPGSTLLRGVSRSGEVESDQLLRAELRPPET